MIRGDLLIVKDFRGRQLKRVMWEEWGTSIVVCTEEDYNNWELTGKEPRVVGFPLEDVESAEKLAGARG
jgi:hypothetical protein